MEVQSSSEVEAIDVEATYLHLETFNKGVMLRLSEPLQLTEGTGAGNLFVCSNLYGFVIVANNQGFCLFLLETIRNAFATAQPSSIPTITPVLKVTIPIRVAFIKLAMSEKLLVVGMSDGSVGVWDLQRLAAGNTTPLNGFPTSATIIDILPCPALDSPILVVLTTESLSVFSLSTFQPLITFPSYLNITSACWSVKGKQIIVGMKGGGLAQFTPEGEKKAEIIPPLSVQGAGYDVRSIHWLENHVFLVTYARPILPGTQPLHDDEVYLITRDASGGVKEYVKFGDPAPAFGMMERPGRRWIASLKTWTPLKHLLFMANAPSINIGLIGQLEDSNWVAVSLPDTSRPSLSPSEVTDSDTCPVGLELDFAKVDGKIEPRLLVYTSDGVLAAWKINNVIGGEYGAVVGTPVASISPFSSQTPSAFSSQTPSAFSSQTPSAISSQTPSAFASPASTANAFGSSGFGVPPVFGSTPAFGASTFGSSGFSAKPVTGGFSSFGTPSVLPTPVSVDSAFGLTASSGGFSNFKNVTSGPVASAFGAFGSTQSSGFGGAATTTDAVKSNWGSGSSFAPSPAFGTVSAKPSAFGQATTPAVPLAFPSATTNTPFGQSAPAASFPAFASPVTGTSPFTASSRTSVFGASSTPPAFGAKPVTFGTASTTSAFSSSGPRVTGMEMGRRGQVEDEDEEEMEPIEEVRGDDPPDLEPTRTGLAFGEGVIERVAPVEVPLPLAASSLGFGGLGLSASSTIIAPVTGIFGPQPVVVVAQVKTTSAGFGFGFGASAFPTAPAISSFGNSSSSAFGVATTSSAFGTATTSAFGTSTTSAFGSSPFGQPSVSAFEKPIASISAFDSTPKVQELPAIEAVASKGSISVTEIISPAPSPPISSTPPIFSTPPRSVTPPNLASVGVSTTPAGVPPATSSTKSFFGFASSPPMNTVGLARANSISQVVESDSQKRFGDETVEGEEEDIYSDEAEEEDEEEGEEDEEEEYSEEGEGEEYDEDALYDEAERTMPLRDHSQEVEESQVEEEEELTEEEEEEVATAVKPDRLDRVENPLLARLETQSKVDSPTISPPVIAEKQIAIPAISPLPTPNSFPFLPTTTSPFGLPSKIPSPFSLTPTPPPIIAPAVDPSLFTLPKPTLGGVIPNKPIFGLNNLATPRSSSPLSFGSTTPSFPPPPPTSIPSAFSLKPAVITETIPKPSFIPGSFGNILPASAIPLPLSAPQTPSLISPVSPITLPTFPSVTFKPTPPSSIPPTPDRNGFPLGSTIAPKLGDNISNGKSVKVEETGMTGEFLKTYQILESEFAVLRKNTIICQSFVKEISLPCQTTKQANDFDDSHWSMGDLERLKALTIEVSPKISSLVSIAIGQKRQVAELQSLMLKAETKREEAARFIRAKSDPAVARMVRVRQLGPEQSETQKKLRASVQAATSQLEQLEDHLLLVKDKIVEDRLGQSSFKTPPLDDVNRTIHNISTLVIRKTNEIDELSLRLNMARVSAASNSTPKNSTPQKSSRHRSPSVDTLLGTSTLGSSPGIKAPPILNPDVIATADASLLAERNVGILKRALLAVRTKPLLNKSACTKNGKGGKNQFTDLQTAFSAGPITGNNLPLPRRQDVQSIPFPEAFAASSSTLPPSWSFSNPSTPIQKSNIVGLKAPSFISFNTPTSPAVNHDSPSSISKRGAPSKTSRSSTHASATSLKTTNAYNKSFIPPPNPSFDWGPIPTPSISNTRDFISFDGLQTPEVVKIEPITLKEDDVIDSSEEEEEGEEGDDSDNELEAEDGWDENEFDGEGVISLDDIPEE